MRIGVGPVQRQAFFDSVRRRASLPAVGENQSQDVKEPGIIAARGQGVAAQGLGVGQRPGLEQPCRLVDGVFDGDRSGSRPVDDVRRLRGDTLHIVRRQAPGHGEYGQKLARGRGDDKAAPGRTRVTQ